MWNFLLALKQQQFRWIIPSFQTATIYVKFFVSAQTATIHVNFSKLSDGINWCGKKVLKWYHSCEFFQMPQIATICVKCSKRCSSYPKQKVECCHPNGYNLLTFIFKRFDYENKISATPAYPKPLGASIPLLALDNLNIFHIVEILESTT